MMSDDVQVSDLVLTDEHDTVGMDDTLADAAGKLVALRRGILIVLGDDNKVKGVISPAQILVAVAGGIDVNSDTCGMHMDGDVMEVGLDDDIDAMIKKMNARQPHAVVAVDLNGEFSGYFSPNDYREALARLEAKPAIRKLAKRE
ncbi:MAG: hypothetical protein CXX71_00640 [Methanobacteriota archaeon]|nr:MAG: hypothetical protein CXX71_00640 [Euryarchaeota archaeon]